MFISTNVQSNYHQTVEWNLEGLYDDIVKLPTRLIAFKTTILHFNKRQTRVSSRVSCLSLEEKIWQVLHGSPHTQLCCSSHAEKRNKQAY